MNEELLKAIVTIAAGALTGGLTNTVAIWMLFHPIKPPAVLGRPIRLLQGAIPKNQPRLAKAIGRTVGDTLLTTEDLARTFDNPEFRAAFDEKLDDFLTQVLDVERGSLREIFGPEGAAKADQIAGEVVNHALHWMQGYVASDAFESAVRAKAGKLAEFVADASAGDVLTSDRRARIEAAATEWIERAVSGDRFREFVGDYVREGAEKLLASERTVREMLPEGAGAVVEKTLAGYLPLAVRRLGKMLESPAVRRRFEAAVHDVLERFKGGLKFHQKLVANLVIKDDTVEQVLNTIEADGVDRLARLLRERPVQAAMEKGIRDAVAEFLDRPMNQVLGDREDPAWEGALAAGAEEIVGLARSPATRAFVVEKLGAFLDRASERTWGDLAGKVSQEQVSAWVVEAARSDVADKVYREGARRLTDAALNHPVGRPARILPGNLAQQVRLAAGDPMWNWLQGQVPGVVAKVNVAQRVEDKIAEFPIETMEDLVRRVTERELRMIVRLGYALGLFVGVVLVAVNRLWG